MISNPFNSSLLTPSLVSVPLVDTGFGVFVTAVCVVSASVDGSPVEVLPVAPQADKIMDAINSRDNIFFMA
jgi:hypothetical protein